MYSIFSTNSRAPKHLQEGEPPPKKLNTEGNVLIKKLVENQLKTDSTLVEQLYQKKEFTPSQAFTNDTGHIRGETRLEDFQVALSDVDEKNSLRRKGLTDSDIEIYREFSRMGSEFWLKHTGISRDMLEKRLNTIQHLVQEPDTCQSISSWAVSRHVTDYITAVKPQSIETKLFKFATLNKPQTHLQGPMDQLPAIEKQLMSDIEEFSKCDLKKIRKSARSLGRKIESLNMSNSNPKGCADDLKQDRKTLWDVKQSISAAKPLEIVDKSKVYGCKPQNWYTVKDGNVIKLNPDRTLAEPEPVRTGRKLSLDEIKAISKFSNYEVGSPSKVLFVKNISKRVTANFLRTFLQNHQLEPLSIKVMTGKMNGQTFIYFLDVDQATRGLEALNGVLADDRPIVVQFGKKRT